MRKYRAIFFDLDGVLLDSEKFFPGSWLWRTLERTTAALGIPSDAECLKRFVIHGFENIVTTMEEICQEFGIESVETLWRVREKNFIQEKTQAMVTGEIGPFPDVEAVKRLSSHYALTIVSNSPQPIVDDFVVRFDLEDHFTHWIGRGSGLESLSYAKPSPFLIEQMTQRVGSKQIVYVGDADYDLLAATRAGVDYIHLSRDGTDTEIKPGVQSLQTLWELVELLVHDP